MRIIYTIILLVLLAISFSKAQWKTTVEENNIISAAPNTQNYPSVALDKTGGFFVAWTDARNSSTGNDIYIQRFDSLGNTYFADNGIPVCVADGNQQYPWAVGTTDSCIIVFWYDDRPNYTNSTDLYAQKLDREGNPLWEVNGVPVSQYNDPTPGALSEISIVPDDNGGAYISWTRSYYGYGQLRAQRIDTNGNIMWDSTGAILTDGAVDTRSPRIVRNQMGISVVYRFTSGGYAIYYQIVDSTGSLKFPAPGKLVTVDGPQVATSVALADTANGEAVIISWPANSGGLFAQAIDTLGNKLWGDDPVAINNVPGGHSELRIVRSYNTTDYYLVWKDGRRINVANDIYAQKLNNLGQAQWTENGIKVSGTPYTFTNVSMSTNNNGIYVSWSETNNPQGQGIYAQRINPDSTFAWQSNSVRLTDQFVNAGIVTLNPDINNGGAVVIFSYAGPPSGTGENLYAKYIGANGVLGGVTSIEEESINQPNGFYLSQNYPNPFNPSTKISWQSPVGSHQTLKVYDVLGNEVATLVDEYRSAGRYEVDFDASGLSSGVYFYTLQIGTNIQSKKMILMK
ncbi:MAG: T9SS type A sorting domain-containing protein [Ignavibacterium sp.]